MFQIDTKKTKEENLAAAEAYSNAAREIWTKVEELKKEALKIVPAGYCGTEARRKKAENWNEVLDRLQQAMRKSNEIKQHYDYRERDELEKRKIAEKVEAQQKAAEERIKLAGEAIQYLLNLGKVLNTDFTTDNAVEIANNIAFELEIVRRKAALKETKSLTNFDGMNCDDCPGWDGESRRCQCGNRRVSWSSGWGHSFKEPYIYGEAY